MTSTSRDRLARVVREPDADLAEAALLCCVEVEADLDVDAELLRLDALADQLRAGGFTPTGAQHDAAALARYLGSELGFTGDETTYHDPRNALLTQVLDRRRGLPITLSIAYIAIGRRAGIRAYPINTPGHFLVGVAGPHSDAGQPPAILDPFHDGALLTEEDIARRLEDATAGLTRFTRAMLRPAPAPVVIRRLLNNLTRDFLGQGDTEDALWTVELKRLLPGTDAQDVRTAGELLIQLGRYRDAADTLDAFLDSVGDRAASDDQVEDLKSLAIRARAKMN